MSIYFVSTSFCELDPAVGDQAIGIFGGHLNDAILCDRGALARPGLDRADPWRRLEADIDRLRRRQFFGHFSIVLEDALVRHWPLEPLEELRGGIDLVVMLAIGKDGHLVEVFGEPRCGLRDIDKAVLDHRGLGIQPHGLVGDWLVSGDTMTAVGDQFLDQLGARGLVLMLRNARDRGISVMSGSDTGNASAFSHGRWHGKEAELLVKEVGIPPMEAVVANASRNAWLMGLEGEVGVIAPGKLADIVIWNSDPLADITVLQRPS